MKSIAAALLGLAVLASCTDAPSTVVMDGWWNADYAKITCEQAKAWQKDNGKLATQVGCAAVTACPEMAPIVAACALDPTLEVRGFETMVATEFASNKDCSSIRFVHFATPKEPNKDASDALTRKHWTLSLNYTPGAKQQRWAILGPENKPYLEGEGDPGAIAKKICAIVTHRGAAVSN